MERTGNNETGSITALYTILVQGGDMEEPIADEVRGILDGHIILSRKLGQAGHYPAIDVLSSASRLFSQISSREHQDSAIKLRSLLAKYNEIEFLVQVGEYEKGSDALADEAILKLTAINQLLQQRPDEHTDLPTAIAMLQETIHAG
jgi:type III secretion protein N (ATPase)